MSGLNFKKLFKLEVMHSFYKDTKCPDFVIVPSEETASLFLKLKIKWVATDNGIVALYQSKDELGTPFSPITSAVRFSFGLQLKVPHFTNYTELQSKTTPEDKYYYSSTNTFDEEVFPVAPSEITYEFSMTDVESLTGAPVNVYIKKGAEVVLTATATSYDFVDETYYYRVKLKVENEVRGTYSIYRDGEPDEVLLEEVLIEPSFTRSTFFAVVEVVKANNNEELYQLQFEGKKIQWKYYLIFKNGGNTANDHYVTDTATSNAITFTELTPPGEDENKVIATVLEQYPNAEVRIFKSPDPDPEEPLENLISFSEIPRKGIVLKRGVNNVIPHLANPNPKSASPAMFVYIDN